MGQTRTQQPEPTQKQPTPQEDAALIIFAILSGQAVFSNPEEIVTAALLALVPSSLSLRTDISAEAARLVLTDPPDIPKGSGALSAANRENLKYRVAYGFEAIKRLTKAVQDAKQGDGMGERLNKALKVEQGYFKAHQVAEARRTEGFNIRDSIVALYGETLSWHHGPRTRMDRPHHVKADGKNFNAMTIPVATGALPGVLNGCNCFYGPPMPNAKVMQ